MAAAPSCYAGNGARDSTTTRGARLGKSKSPSVSSATSKAGQLRTDFLQVSTLLY